MDFCRKVLLILAPVLFTINVHAQYTEEDGGVESPNGYLRYLGIGAGATYQVMYDEAISPIVYSRVSALPMVSAPVMPSPAGTRGHAPRSRGCAPFPCWRRARRQRARPAPAPIHPGRARRHRC